MKNNDYLNQILPRITLFILLFRKKMNYNKFLCKVCNVEQFLVNFPTGNLLKKCKFCILEEENTSLRKAYSELQSKFAKLEEKLEAIGDSSPICKLDRKVVENQQRICLLDIKMQNSRRGILTPKKGLPKFKPCPPKEIEIPTRNRYSILEDHMESLEVKACHPNSLEEKREIVIGDSIIRDQSSFYGKWGKKRLVLSKSGAKIKNIRDELDLLKVNKQSKVIVSAGSNDVFKRNKNETVRSEDIVKDFEDLVTSIKKKTACGFVVGILPRWKNSRYELSRAIGINARVEKLCASKGLQFIDTWESFQNRKLFQIDGIHLNDDGKRRLGYVIEAALKNSTRVSISGNVSPPQQYNIKI